jgi:hypothetical protein
MTGLDDMVAKVTVSKFHDSRATAEGGCATGILRE